MKNQFSNKQTFSIRKYSLGAVSVLLGIFLVAAGQTASADEVSTSTTTDVSEMKLEVTNQELVETPTPNDTQFPAAEVSGAEEDKVADLVSTKEATPVASIEVSLSPTVENREVAVEMPLTHEAPVEEKQIPESRETKSEAGQATFFSMPGTGRSAGDVIGDDYPSYLKNAAPDTLVDSWNMLNRECTSFVAARLSSANGFNLPGGYGNANSWGGVARSQGYRVDSNPTVGSVAWFDSWVGGAYGYGHVAWVAGVSGDQVEIEEYNYGYPSHRYNSRFISKQEASGFIHFKDLAGGAANTAASQPANSDSGLAPSGVYRFTGLAGVKNAPSMSARNIAHYNAGQTVNYDKVVESEGHKWISYISYSGARRYIAVGESSEPAAPRLSIPASGVYRFTGRASVKNEARMSAPELAYYDAGQTVNYDRTLQAEGHQWISYISYSGARRYIAIN